ncbi:MAG: hypothetical protein V7647_3839 [Acidobacteriota bacterium]
MLLLLHGRPIGVLHTGPEGCTASELARLCLDQHGWAIARHLAADQIALGSGRPAGAPDSLDDLLNFPAACHDAAPPRTAVTVAVCTRNRSTQLAECLEALLALDYPADLLDILVVDNAPSDDSTRRTVAAYPRIRYACEPRPGLDWARNRAILESRADIIAYTDDDVSVERNWVRALASAFRDEPEAMCVTGLVVPDEVDTHAQALFERYGGFGRGFERGLFRVDVQRGHSAARVFGGTGRFGTGANMAFRREFFSEAGLFDPALDVGTPTNGGGDLDMFFRVLKSGRALLYEPAAIVRHRHRREYAALKTQIANNGIGFYAYLVRIASTYPDERAAVIALGVWWLWWWNMRRLLASFVRTGKVPRDLIVAELKGSFVGLRRYAAARKHAADVARRYGAPEPAGADA